MLQSCCYKASALKPVQPSIRGLVRHRFFVLLLLLFRLQHHNNNNNTGHVFIFILCVRSFFCCTCFGLFVVTILKILWRRRRLFREIIMMNNKWDKTSMRIQFVRCNCWAISVMRRRTRFKGNSLNYLGAGGGLCRRSWRIWMETTSNQGYFKGVLVGWWSRWCVQLSLVDEEQFRDETMNFWRQQDRNMCSFCGGDLCWGKEEGWDVIWVMVMIVISVGWSLIC